MGDDTEDFLWVNANGEGNILRSDVMYVPLLSL